MKQSTDCHCGGSDHDAGCSCGQVALERPRYFPRQLLTPVELTLEQQYFRDRLRRHNRLLHGWGVVCGAAVCRVPGEPDPETRRTEPQPWKVRVQTGYVLGPYGDEILLDHEQVVDLRTVGLTADGCGDPVDPWCSDVFVKRDQGPLYVAVRYAEVQTRPVRVQPVGCGCEDTQCELSRLRDSFDIGILTACPQSHQRPPSRDEIFKGSIPGCPPCPAEPWVVLARVDLDADGNVKKIDNCSCRRLVAGFGVFWWQCQGDPCLIESVQVKGPDGKVRPDNRVSPGEKVTVVIRTTQDPPQFADISFGEGLDHDASSTTGREITTPVTVQPTAETGPRTLKILDPANALLAEKENALFVVARTATFQPAPQAEPASPPPAPQPQPSPQAGGPAPAPAPANPEDVEARQPQAGKGKKGNK
jgi:hypothetical protein